MNRNLKLKLRASKILFGERKNKFGEKVRPKKEAFKKMRERPPSSFPQRLQKQKLNK